MPPAYQTPPAAPAPAAPAPTPAPAPRTAGLDTQLPKAADFKKARLKRKGRRRRARALRGRALRSSASTTAAPKERLQSSAGYKQEAVGWDTDEASDDATSPQPRPGCVVGATESARYPLPRVTYSPFTLPERVTTHDTIVSACTLTIGLEWASLGKCWLEYTKWQDYRL